MESEKKNKSPLCFFFNILGKNFKETYIKYQAKKNLSKKDIEFSGDIKDVKKILFIMPDDVLEAFYQVENILSIMNKYDKSEVYILTGLNSAPWFKHFYGIKNLFSYDSLENCFFSQSMKDLKDKLKEHTFDICFILDRIYSLNLKYFITQIDSNFRISYFENCEYPYSNLRIKGTEDSHAVDNNLLISRSLKISLHDKLHWSVSKESIEEITHSLKEHGIKGKEKIGCIDVDFFVSYFGREWTSNLILKLKSQASEYAWFIYVESASDEKYADWLRSLSLPCFYDLSPTRTAALLFKSEILLSGKSYLFELSFLLKRKALGIFNEDDMKRNCRNNAKSKGISISQAPNDETISKILSKLKDF